MAIVTIRPESTVVNTMALVGAASGEAALSDNSDSSFIEAPHGYFTQAIFNLPDYALPANSFLRQVRIRIRYRTIDFYFSNITYWVARLITSTGHYGAGDSQSTITFTPQEAVGAWRTKAPSGADWTQEELNATQVDIYPGYYAGNTQMPRIYEVFVDLDFNTSPTATITSPGNDTQITTSRPPLLFTYSDADGDAMEGYRAKLFHSASYTAPGFDPNTWTPEYDTGKVGAYSPPPGGVIPPVDLNNQTSYRWYVWVYQQGGPTGTTGFGVSQPAYTGFAVSVIPPATPSITPVVNSAGGYVTLVTAAGTGPTGTPATTSILIERTQDAGITWQTVRGTPVAPGSSVIDYQVIPNKGVIYRGRAFSSNPTLASAYSASTALVTIFDNEWRLRDPSNPSVGIVLNVTDDRMVQRKPEDKAFFSPMGRTRKVPVSDVIRGEESQFTLEFLTKADFDAFESLRNLQKTLLLTRGWTAEGWYIQFEQVLEMTLYNYSPTYRTITISWIEVDAP